MTKRIIPSVMSTTVEATPSGVEKAKAETARVQNLDPNLCPICSTTLVSRVTNGLAVKVCMAHNIVMPVKDEV